MKLLFDGESKAWSDTVSSENWFAFLWNMIRLPSIKPSKELGLILTLDFVSPEIVSVLSACSSLPSRKLSIWIWFVNVSVSSNKISELDRNIGDFTDYKVLIKRENAYFYKNDQQKIELKK